MLKGAKPAELPVVQSTKFETRSPSLRAMILNPSCLINAPVRALVTDKIERGHAVVVASHRFAIDDAGARA